MITAKEVPCKDLDIIPASADYSKSKCKRLEGILLKILSLCFFAMMQILTKSLYLHSTISSLELLYFRGLIMLGINLTYSKYISLDILDLPKEQFKPMCYRSIIGAIGNMLFFTSTKLFPLSLVSAMSYLSPIMTAALSFIFLKETLTKYDVGSMLFAFIGVVIIVFNPYKNADLSEFYNIKWWYYFFPLFNPIFAANVTLLLRYMGKSIHCILAPTYLAITISSFTPVLTFAAVYFRQTITIFTGTVMLYLVGIGFAATMGQILVSRSLQIEKAGRVQSFNYLMIVFMLMADLFIFGIPIQWLDLIGIVIILSSNFLVASLRGCGLI